MAKTYKPLPLIPWMGGKRRLAKHILPHFPQHDCYVELFTGGGALFFLKPSHPKSEVLNDLNGDLVNLYRVVQNHFDEFCRQFDFTLSSRSIFKTLKDTCPETLTDIQRAARFFYLQQHAFGAKVSGQNFGTATTAKTFDLTTIKDKLSAARKRLGGVHIEHEHWDQCFKRYDREHTFFYADPPYWQTAGYDSIFPWSEYEKLAEAMSNAKGKFLLSINDHPDIRNLFSKFKIKELSIKYCVGGGKQNKTFGELLVSNF